MNAAKKTAPAGLRWASHLLTLLLTLLLIWLLGFLVTDIGNIEGPRFEETKDQYLEDSLVDRKEDLEEQIEEVETKISREKERQQTLRQSMNNAREVMDQMMSLHRLSLEEGVKPSDTEQQALADSQNRYLNAQEEFETANEQIANLESRRHSLKQELKQVDEEIESQLEPAREKYEELREAHEFKVAALKLAVVVPLLLVAAWAFYRYRQSPYRPILIAALIATFWRVGVVMFQHFPRDFFKYIAIGTAIAIVLGFLVRVLRKVIRPGIESLVKRYREAYHNHQCPICAYPIIRGPFRHAIWTRKGPIGFAPQAETARKDETPYACPACGTTLYESCEECGSDRHSLLPYCESCGKEKTVAS